MASGKDARKRRLLNVSAALGLTSISSFWVLGPLSSPYHIAIYHWSGPPWNLFIPALLDFVIAWVLILAILISAEGQGRWRVVVWAGVTFFLPAVALKSWALYSAVTPSHELSGGLWLSGLAGWMLVVLFGWPTSLRNFERGVKFVSVLLAFVAIPGATLLCQVVWVGWQARHLNDPEPGNREAHALSKRATPRVLWIVLDELSYQQVYGARFPGLQLPAFDSLAKQATVFTNVKPAGMFTERILPELLTGRPDDLIRSSPQGELFLHDPGKGEWDEFDQHQTVFEDALADGYGTAIVGWYNPYCRIMANVLDRCFWTVNSPLQNGMFAKAGIWSNVLQPLEFLLSRGPLQRVLGKALGVPLFRQAEARRHIGDFESLSSATDGVLSDRSATFVLFHLPIPHTPGIYDRAKQAFTDGPSDYIDNLALADRYIAHVRDLLERTGQWNDTTLIVMGDHSWRVPVWRPTENWTAEEEKASHEGQFDTRPFYAVRLAGQYQGGQINSPFSAVETRDLLDALLSRKVTSALGLSDWARIHSLPEAGR